MSRGAFWSFSTPFAITPHPSPCFFKEAHPSGILLNGPTLSQAPEANHAGNFVRQTSAR
jgi:hypothetical protein